MSFLSCQTFRKSQKTKQTQNSTMIFPDWWYSCKTIVKDVCSALLSPLSLSMESQWFECLNWVIFFIFFGTDSNTNQTNQTDYFWHFSTLCCCLLLLLAEWSWKVVAALKYGLKVLWLNKFLKFLECLVEKYSNALILDLFTLGLQRLNK